MKKKTMQLVSLIGLVIALAVSTTSAQTNVTFDIQTGSQEGAGGYGEDINVQFVFVSTNGVRKTCETTLKNADLSNSALSKISEKLNCSVLTDWQLEKIFVTNNSKALNGTWFCRWIKVTLPEKGTATFSINRWFANGTSSVGLVNPFYKTPTGVTPVKKTEPNAARFLLQIGTPLLPDVYIENYLLAGNGDLFAIKTGNTGTKRTEVHVLTAASNYQKFRLQTGTALEETRDFEFGLAVNDDLFAIKEDKTGTGKIELHVLSAASNYQKFILHTPTALSRNNFPRIAYKFLVAPNRDLIGITNLGTASKSYEVYILSAASNYQTFTSHILPIKDSEDFDFALAPNGDLFGIKKSSTGTNSTEVHVLSAASNYQEFILHTGTLLPQPEINYLYEFGVTAERNLFTIKKQNTDSKSVEVHILDLP